MSESETDIDVFPRKSRIKEDCWTFQKKKNPLDRTDSNSYVSGDYRFCIMETRTITILLLCLISAAVVVTGCTSQNQGTVTTAPATTVPLLLTTRTIATVMTSETTIGVTATLTVPGTSMPVTTAGTPTVSPAEVKSETVMIRAKNFAFDVPRITVPAGAQVTVEFENEDSAPHNVAFYTTPSLSATIYKGKIIDGPGKITYVFTAPATPGTYFFRCDLHPTMKGEFVVT